MVLTIITLLIIIAGVSITLLFSTGREMNRIARNLGDINTRESNERLRVSTTSKALRNLVIHINNILSNKQQSEIRYKNIDRELREAIANISHDLRTPLTSIRGYMQLIKNEDMDEDEKREYIEIVDKRAKSLQSLLEGFYDLSRLEAKEYEFDLKSINLYEILCDVLAGFYNEFTLKGFEPVINLSEDVPNIIGDENAVRRVFINLMQNTLKHGEKIIDISLEKHEKYLVTTFTNDAPDLKEEDVVHIFERFFTGDRMRTGQNTGIGLAITKTLVEQMGYNISAILNGEKLSIIIKWKYNRT